jgi:hypothetical protein
MLIKACLKCKFHEIKPGEEAQISFCRKEGCWSEHSDCIALKALQRFLNEERESPTALEA